jgi:hypothetical protein
VGRCSSPLSCGAYHTLAAVTNFPLSKLLGGCHPSCLLRPACLFTVQMGHVPPPLYGVQGVPPSLLHVWVFFSCLCIIQFVFFSFFPGWGSLCPGGYADLFKGCLWEYHMPLSSPGVLLLPSRIGAGVWQHGSPPGFSV